MIMHVDARDFKPCYVFCDGEDISNTCFFADEEAGVAYCYYHLSEVSPEGKISPNAHAMLRAFPDDVFATGIRIPDDAMIIRKRVGKIEVIEDLKRRRV